VPQATRHAVSKSSARPCAAVPQSRPSRARQRSRLLAGQPDVIEGVSGPKISVWTGRPVTASNVIGPMNSRAPRVITTSTSAPACVSKRASHTDL
jgi:hypothetical protein